MAKSSRWESPLLAGERVALRQLDAGDVDAVWEMVNDAEGSDLTATTDTFAREQTEEWCRSRPTQDERLDLAIVDNETGEFVGEVVLNDFDPAADTCNFRISLRGPAWYGRGLGTEATRLIVAHGLDTIGLRAITLEVLARNPRAQAVYAKVGFVTVREFDEDGETWVEMRITSSPRCSSSAPGRTREEVAPQVRMFLTRSLATQRRERGHSSTRRRVRRLW